jgi:hypothetical protein
MHELRVYVMHEPEGATGGNRDAIARSTSLCWSRTVRISCRYFPISTVFCLYHFIDDLFLVYQMFSNPMVAQGRRCMRIVMPC